MKKSLLCIFTLCVGLMFASEHKAMAAITIPGGDNYSQIFTTGAQNSTTPQSVFSWDQKPWLYLQLETGASDPIGSNRSTTQWQWQDIGGAGTNYYRFYNANTNQLWIGFSDAVWNSIKKPGDWNIQSDTFLGTTHFTGNTQFRLNAAPEPVSSVLFVFGAGVLGFGLLNRRKQFAV